MPSLIFSHATLGPRLESAFEPSPLTFQVRETSFGGGEGGEALPYFAKMRILHLLLMLVPVMPVMSMPTPMAMYLRMRYLSQSSIDITHLRNIAFKFRLGGRVGRGDWR